MLDTLASYITTFLFLRLFLSHWKTFYQGFRGYVLHHKVDLKQKYGDWAVITGSTDGIGKGYALALAKRGLNVVIIGRNITKLKAVQDEIQNRYQVDVRTVVADFKSVEVYEELKKELEDIDVGILVNNVGISPPYPMLFIEVNEKLAREILNVNVHSVTMMTHAVLPKMLEKKKGAIVNISSISVTQPVVFMSHYSASKIFVNQMSETLRYECSNKGLTIQTVTPFYVSTKINEFSDDLRKQGLFIPDPETYANHAVDTIGIMDYTFGYFPHSLQYFLCMLAPKWLRTVVGSWIYIGLRKKYFKTLSKVK